MAVLAFLISIGVFIYVMVKNDSHSSANKNLNFYVTLLEKRIKELEKKIRELEQVNSGAYTPKQEAPKAEPQKTNPSVSEAPKYIRQLPVETEVVKTVTPRPTNVIEKSKVNTVPNKSPEVWTKIEKQFVENWTGILGAVIMVVGVGFLGIYAALKLSAFNRFLLISAFAGLLTGIFFYLRKQEKWLKLALWLRSSAGAIFLFACLGSAGIAGLQWIDDPFYGLALLVAGIAVNLYLGYAGGSQVFAFLHVLLSLVALSIAPAAVATLIMAALVSLFGIGLTFREKWDYHLLLTVSSFFIYHLYWYYQQTGFTFDARLMGIATVLTVSVTVALVHYRKVYKTMSFDALPFIVHLINWFYFGIGLFLYSTGDQLATIFIVCGSVAAFFLSRRAKKLEIRWLHHTDTLMAQVAAIIALITLYRWHIDGLTIIGAIFIETMIFLFIMLKEDEEFLYKVGTVALNLVGIVLLIDAVKTMDYSESLIIYNHSLTLFVCFLSGIVFQVYNFKKNKFDFSSSFKMFEIYLNPKIKTPVFAIILGLILSSVYLNIYTIEWSEYFIVPIVCILIYVRNKYQSIELVITAFIPLLSIHLINWLSHDSKTSEIDALIHCSPFLLVSIAAIKWSYVEYFNKYINWIGIYLFALHTIIISYFIFNPISPLIPALFWLSLSAVALEISRYTSRKFAQAPEYKNQTDRFLLHVGYILIAAFIVRHIMVDLQSELYLGGIIKIRLLIELFALAIFTFWVTIKKPDESKYRSWINLHPLLIELIILFSIMIVSLEASVFWQPIIWIASAFVLGFLGNWKKEKLSRLLFYSLVMYWVTAFQDSFITSSYNTPSTEWYDQAWLSGCIAIGLQFIFLTYFYKKCSLEDVHLPKALSFLQNPIKKINKNRNSWIFYPLIICTAIFLFWSFDKSILTLLWVLECFMLFILSVILKEKNFRYVALAALVLCIVRLIFYDLAQTSTLTRALVFFGVGIILLVMNSIYNKYKDRFTNE